MRPEQRKAAAGDQESAAAVRGPRHPLPLLEWVVGGLGAALVGGAIAFLVYHSLTRDHTPPDVRVAAQGVLDLQNGYLVQFRAFNEGASAAAELTIEGELTDPDGGTEVSEAVLDYLPPRSGREGGLWFSRDPRAGQLSLRATGYVRP